MARLFGAQSNFKVHLVDSKLFHLLKTQLHEAAVLKTKVAKDEPRPWPKKVDANYLVASGLMSYLEGLRFHLVGYGCTTCIASCGPLAEHITKAIIVEGSLSVAAILSGNRNLEGRINSYARAKCTGGRSDEPTSKNRHFLPISRLYRQRFPASVVPESLSCSAIPSQQTIFLRPVATLSPLA
ncbi:MAG: aconitase family protein [Desulfuromonadaceae bacterium]|nr:aconitase family protein [Desulfuromonadaceae bacterium]